VEDERDKKNEKNELAKLNMSFQNLHESLAIAGRDALSSALEATNQMKVAIGVIGDRHRELSTNYAAVTDISHMSRGLYNATDTLLDLAGQLRNFNPVSFDPNQISKSWLEVVPQKENLDASIRSLASINLSKVVYESTVTEGLFSRIDLAKVGASFGLSAAAASSLEASYSELTRGYKTFVDSFKNLEDITRYPRDITLGANREVFLAGYVIDSLAVERSHKFEPEETQLYEDAKAVSSEFSTLLDSIDPALSRMYSGAEEAFKGNNPDRARHVLSSTRELWSNLMWKLAPDEEVINWIPKDQSDYIKDGKPTRRARILYICRNVNSHPLSKIVDADAKVFSSTYDLLNRVHILDPGFNDSQLEMMLIRTKCFLMYLIEIGRIR
jgi:hypothetical protein